MVTYYALALTFLGLWFALLRLWQARVADDIAAGAQIERDRLLRSDPELMDGLSEKGFSALFRKVETPRQPAYVFVAGALFLLLAPMVLALTTIAITFLEVRGIIPQPAEQAQNLRVSGNGFQLIGGADLTTLQYILEGWGGFFSFFALLALWVIILVATMRRYHARRPGSLREEVLRSR